MRLMSCYSCGVVLDYDQLDFPNCIQDAEGEVLADRAGFNGEDWVPKTVCPVCKAEILEDT